MKLSRDRRRLLLLAGAGAMVQAVPARAFDRVAAGDRYRAWLGTLNGEVRALLAAIPRDRPVGVDDIDRGCRRSVVPGSRFAHNLAQWLDDARRRGPARSAGEIVYAGPLVVVTRLLASSIPAGQGGLFAEPPGSDFAAADKTLTVWYMHIHGGESLKAYFADGARFKPYRLPPDGRLERAAYPFLMFEDNGSTLRLGGLSGEFFGAAAWLDQMQYQ